MPFAANLATRITALLLLGFVLLQLFVFAAMELPPGGRGAKPYNLPLPAQFGTMVDLLDHAPHDRRAAIASLFEQSLFTVHLLPAAPPATGDETAADLRDIRARFAAAAPGHAVTVEGGMGSLARIIRQRPGPLRYFSPIRVVVALRGGDRLVIDSRPSPPVRTFLRTRALVGLVGGLAVLGALALGIRAMMRPLSRMSAGVRRFATALDAPDLPVTGPREVRALSIAFNDMKERIGGLIADRTRILAAIAHDMRTYLTRLRLRAEFIDDPEQRAKAIADLGEMTLLLDDTLLFAKTESGAGAPVRRIDLAAELEAIVAIRIEMGEAVTLAVDGSAAILIDRLALRRMLSNLIDNGLRHGGAVGLRLRIAARAEIAVTDDGPGVPEAMLAQLGRPFVRADPSRDRASGGAGLGLAIVRALADQAGGTLIVANRAPRGFSATLAFPLAPALRGET